MEAALGRGRVNCSVGVTAYGQALGALTRVWPFRVVQGGLKCLLAFARSAVCGDGVAKGSTCPRSRDKP